MVKKQAIKIDIDELKTEQQNIGSFNQAVESLSKKFTDGEINALTNIVLNSDTMRNLILRIEALEAKK